MAKYLGECWHLTDRLKIQPSCCGSCHEDHDGGYNDLSEVDCKEGFFSVCCQVLTFLQDNGLVKDHDLIPPSQDV